MALWLGSTRVGMLRWSCARPRRCKTLGAGARCDGLRTSEVRMSRPPPCCHVPVVAKRRVALAIGIHAVATPQKGKQPKAVARFGFMPQMYNPGQRPHARARAVNNASPALRRWPLAVCKTLRQRLRAEVLHEQGGQLTLAQRLDQFPRHF